MNKILIIGHGQLGLMMAGESARLGMHVDRLDLQTGDVIGGTSSLRSAMKPSDIIDYYDIISCELEHLPDTDVVNALTQSGKWVNKEALDILPNRQSQKTLIDSLELATAPWLMLENKTDLVKAQQQLGDNLIVKTTTGGYDGKGQWRLTKDDKAIPDEILGGAICEQKIAFQRELSIIGVRNKKGEIQFLPLAENVHHEGILRFSQAGHVNDKNLEKQAHALLTKLMDKLNYIGVMAVECFDCDGQLLINEIAPRVHNSGHWSQLGANYNQFYLHILALNDVPLPTIKSTETIMLNLIGCNLNLKWFNVNGVDIHWYGKEVRPFRKVGHINVKADDIEAINELIPLLNNEHAQFLRAGLSS